MKDVLEDTSIRILPVEAALVPQMWEYLWPHMERSCAQDPDFDLEKLLVMIADGLTQVWSVWRGPRVIAAWCTTFLNDGDYPGEMAMDMHALGGDDLMEWRDLAGELMIEWATANKADRIIFRGRKCLARAYAPLDPIICRYHEGNGIYLFERKLS